MQQKIISAPTPFYPSSDGKPMAETDWHRKLLLAKALATLERLQTEKDDAMK